MEPQTRIGVGAACAIAIIALAEPHMSWLLAISVYGFLSALAIWGFWPLLKSVLQRGLSALNILPGNLQKYEDPIARAVTHVRTVINDLESDKCFPATCKAIRQAALDGSIKIRGRREIDNGSQQTAYSDVRSDIPAKYWEVSTIGPLATDERCRDDVHTGPETAFSWGQKGPYAKNHYADLRVSMKEIKRVWPHEPD